MEIEGKYVETKGYRKILEKCGFKYLPFTKSFFLSYPYVPKRFQAEAVKVELYNGGLSPVAKISNIEYYRHGSGYERTDSPDKDFKNYVETILYDGLEQTYPKYMPV